jgi:dihydrofolate synthase/folylpolyglutamate synthase
VPFVEFIEQKPLYYKEIDHERIHLAYDLLKSHIHHPQTIHIVGTNGKGSTGRILAHLAYSSHLKVGHFSSPHILKFNERVWLNGEDSSDEVLEIAHQKLYTIIGSKMSRSLSYFEYTTLLALVVFENVDLIVLEAGLGGEYDATNVCPKDLSIITPIGIDHQSLLGDTIEEIASTKIRSIQDRVLLAPQRYREVVEVAYDIARDRGATLYRLSDDRVDISGIVLDNSWANYLEENAQVAIKALDILGIDYEIEDLRGLKLFARYYPLSSNIHIDVGHNPLAAQAIVEVLERESTLIYNSLDDKDYTKVLEILKPKISKVEIIPIPSQRAATLDQIEKSISSVGLEYSIFDGSIDRDREYIVFGSFLVVEEFLKIYQAQNTDHKN